MTLVEVALLLNGWKDEKSRLRVIAVSPELKFSAFCTVYVARPDLVIFAVDGNNLSLVEFSLAACNCGFAGEPDKLEVGGKVESAILAVRGDFNLTICLLAT
jgi:hypothetical protein